MAKFFGEIGYGETVETVPGVWKDVIVEKQYYGDVLRNTRKLESGEKLNNDISVGNSVSILADSYANSHFHAIRYIRWMGALWTVSDVEEKSPRLILRMGGIYNGQTPEPASPV